jgi:hypothetical protein
MRILIEQAELSLVILNQNCMGKGVNMLSVKRKDLLEQVAIESAGMSWPGQMPPILKAHTKLAVEKYSSDQFMPHLCEFWSISSGMNKADFACRNLMARRKETVVIGVDLAGSARRATGICVLRRMRARTRIAFGDDDILGAIEQAKPDLVPIDAPLSLPTGRKTIQDRGGEHLRECDRQLQKRKIKFFPITLGPMRMLTERGMSLKAKIETMGYRVVECYPGAAQDVWRIPRQHRDLKGLMRGLEGLGVKGLTPEMTGDELDAVTAALVGRWLLTGRAEMLGSEEGIAIPEVTHT